MDSKKHTSSKETTKRFLPNNCKVLTLLLSLFFTFSFTFGQTTKEDEKETVPPSVNTEIVRKVAVFDIEGKKYTDVTITLKSISADFLIHFNDRVKVKIVAQGGTVIYKKTYKNAFLYIFSSGQIQVGRPRFDQILINKSNFSNVYFGMIREKEGIFL